VCLFLEEATTSIAIMVFFILQTTIDMIGDEAPSPTCIHKQRKKMKMGEQKLPHCYIMRNITMVGSFAHVPIFLGTTHT
jgi:hypothetical protein